MIRWRISNWFFPLHFTYSESCKIELQKTRIGLCCAYFPANEIETPKRENTSFSTGQHKLIVPIYFFNDEHYNCAQIHQVWEFILLVTTFLWSLNEIRTNRLVPSIAEATLRITSTLFVRLTKVCTDTIMGWLERSWRLRPTHWCSFFSSVWNVKRELKYLYPC